MMEKIQNVTTEYKKANESWYLKEAFAKCLFDLLTCSNEEEIKKNGYSTVIVHPIKVLKEKYDYSYVAMQGEKIIWSSSIYPTQMTPLDTVSYENKQLIIGEIWSTVINPQYQKQWIGSTLAKFAIEQCREKYEAIVSATINPYRYAKRKMMWFVDATFPQKYYEQWEQCFSKVMKEHWKDFEKESKFTIFCDNQNIKKHLTALLYN